MSLSPLLFVLSLEPLLAMIRNNSEIMGPKVREEEHKLALLFFRSSPRNTLPNLMRNIICNGHMHAAETVIIFMQGGLQGTAWLVTSGCTTVYSELKGLIGQVSFHC